MNTETEIKSKLEFLAAQIARNNRLLNILNRENAGYAPPRGCWSGNIGISANPDGINSACGPADELKSVNDLSNVAVGIDAGAVPARVVNTLRTDLQIAKNSIAELRQTEYKLRIALANSENECCELRGQVENYLKAHAGLRESEHDCRVSLRVLDDRFVSLSRAYNEAVGLLSRELRKHAKATQHITELRAACETVLRLAGAWSVPAWLVHAFHTALDPILERTKSKQNYHVT